MHKTLASFLALALGSHLLAADDPRSQYEAAFTEFYRAQGPAMFIPQMVNQGLSEAEAEQKAQAFVEGTIKCHMGAMDLNSTKLTAPTYAVIVEGGSYPEAKMTYDLASQEAMSANDEEVLAALMVGAEFAQKCMQEAAEEAGL